MRMAPLVSTPLGLYPARNPPLAETTKPLKTAPVRDSPNQISGLTVEAGTGSGTTTMMPGPARTAHVNTGLQASGPFTVFAPTDAAFAALPAGVLDKLLLPKNKDALAKILTYHVVAGKVMDADVTDGEVSTVEGQTIALSIAIGVILPPDVDPAAL
jgi:uncharacterized surface protein with fasciclin (FAS1) repeats